MGRNRVPQAARFTPLEALYQEQRSSIANMRLSRE